MPDYTPEELRQRLQDERNRQAMEEGLLAGLRAKSSEYVAGIKQKEMGLRIDATEHVLDISNIPYRREDPNALSDSERRGYLVRLLAAAAFHSQKDSLASITDS